MIHRPMDVVYGLLVAIHLPALLGLLLLLLPRQATTLRALLSAGAAGVSIALLANLAANTDFTQVSAVGVEWLPQFKMNLMYRADQLGLFFALLVSGVGVLISLYARAYFGPDSASLHRFYPTLLLFMTAMLGLVLADNFMLLLLYWELTSISSFLLIGWDRDDSKAVKNALQAFVVTGAGGLAMMGGLILLGVTHDVWGMTDLLMVGITPGPAATVAFALVFLGAAAKSAQWPLHFWLPGAMAAPTPVSAYLHSATMVKAGVYLLGRVWPVMSGLDAWIWVVIPIGAFTMLIGAYIALRKSDLKQIFAYTTVSQLGLFVCGYGLAAHTGLIWDVTQVLNHALYKAPLFMLAGAIHHVVHTRELHELTGLGRRGGKGQLLAILVVLAAYAMAAMPLTLSFASKEFFLYQIYNWYKDTHSLMAIAVMATTVGAATCTVAIFVRIARVLFADPATAPGIIPASHGAHAAHDAHAGHGADHHPAHDGVFWSAMLWIPAAFLIALQYLGGIVPSAFEAIFGGIEPHRTAYFPYIPSVIKLMSHPGIPLMLSGLAVVLGLLVGFSGLWRKTIVDIHDKLFPGFYALSTQGGGRVFGILQNGHLRTYLIVVFIVIILTGLWGIRTALAWRTGELEWLGQLRMESPHALLAGYVMTGFVCLSAILMVLLRNTTTKVLMLGGVGFAVTAVYYLYAAPDLALTQISIEIVSLILFLLVLRTLTRGEPREGPPRQNIVFRLVISLTLGVTMAGLALISATTNRPVMAFNNAEGVPFRAVGEFLLRNSYDAVDLERSGGGGNNVVNVTLVDFRGLDTLGEITVLGLAAMGVWTLLRRRISWRETHALHRNLSDGDSIRSSADGVTATEGRP